MEKMPYQSDLEGATPAASEAPSPRGNWRQGLPTLHGSVVTMRALRQRDAAPLFASMAADDVRRFIAPPPPTVEAFEAFIDWTDRQRDAGQSVCFAVAARKTDAAIGLFQVRALDLDFSTAEWGFALGVEHWGQGYFSDGADMAIDFAFEVLGVRRLEARTALQNTRGNAVLKSLGATDEAVLRLSLTANGERVDQRLWSILAEDWRATHGPGPRYN